MIDKYLNPFSSYKRLWNEYHKYGSLIVAVDFDDTLFDFHNSGNSYEQIRQLVRDLKGIGCYIIIWTGNQDIEFISSFLNEHNIPFDSINEDAPTHTNIQSRKVYANVYIDDRSGILQVYNDLTKLIENINENN